MAKIFSFAYRALGLLSLLPLTSCSSSHNTSLEARQNTWTQNVFQTTFYGAPDSYKPSENCEASVINNDGSSNIAYPYCSHNYGTRGNRAGGDGSYANPITAASRKDGHTSPVPVCGVWYSPFLRKWLIWEDECPSCYGAPGKAHFDIWIGGNGNGKGVSYNDAGICKCEAKMTPGDELSCAYFNTGYAPGDSHTDIVVNTAPIWDGKNCDMSIPQWLWSGNNDKLSDYCGP